LDKTAKNDKVELRCKNYAEIQGIIFRVAKKCFFT